MAKKFTAPDPKVFAELVAALDGPNPGEWYVQVVESMQADEGRAWRGNLYRSGKLVGTAEYAGHGGPTNVHVSADAREALEVFAKTQTWSAYGQTGDYDGESLIGEVAILSLEIARLRRKAKTKTLFMEDGSLYIFRALTDAADRIRFRTARPTAIILNDMLGQV